MPAVYRSAPPSATGKVAMLDPQLSLMTGATAARPITYRGKRVSPPLVGVALEALSAFNSHAGTRLPPFLSDGSKSDALCRVLGAVTARPEVTRTQWEQAVARAFEEPWWRGAPSIGVVFGPKVVEKHLHPAPIIESPEATKERKRQQRKERQRAAARRLAAGTLPAA